MKAYPTEKGLERGRRPSINRYVSPIWVDACDNIGTSGAPNKWPYGSDGCAVSLAQTGEGRAGLTTLTTKDAVPGTALISATGGTSCYAYRTITTIADVSGAHAMVDFVIAAGNVPITIDLWVQSAATYYSVYRLSGGGATPPVAGRYRWTGTLGRPISVGTGGACSLAAVNQVRVTMSYTNGHLPAVHLDRIMFMRPFQSARPTGGYGFTFDDAYDEHYTAAALLAGYGMTGTFFGPTAYYGAANRLTWAQAAAMDSMGHLIANHSNTHATWANMTTAERTAEIKAAIEALDSRGLSRGSRILRPPFGAWSADDETASRKYIDTLARTASAGQTVADAKQVVTVGEEDPATFCYDDDTEAATGLALAASDNGFCLTGWHDFDGTGVSWADFRTHVAAVGADVWAATLQCVTMEQLIARQL